VGDNVAALFRVPYAPNNVLNANLDWTMLHNGGGNLELFLNYRYQGRQYDTAPTGVNVPGSSEFYSIKPHGVADGRLTWNFDTHGSKKTMRASLWAKNLFNVNYVQHTIGQGAAPYIPVLGASGPVPQTGYYYAATAWAPKAQVGVQLEYGF
jgi:iron complex outermembrane recepter protein